MSSSEDRKHYSQSSAGFTRREILPILGAATALVAIGPRALAVGTSGSANAKPTEAQAQFVYVGTYTFPGTAPGGTQQSQALGIYVFKLNASDGGLTPVQVVSASNPSFLAIDPSLTHLYSVNEDAPEGSVSAYAINPSTGTLSLLNKLPAGGRFTTHISVHSSGKYVLAANYGELKAPAAPGNFAAFLLNPNGSLAARTDLFQSVGYGDNAGPNPDRQETVHGHQIITDLSGSHVCAVDLGADKVNTLNLNLATGKLTSATVPFAPLASGSGPRHMAFHSDKLHAYVLDELVSSITVFKYDSLRGAFIWVQTISTLPPDFTGANTTAEIRVHPTGQYLYNTNRGHNSVTMYSIDQDTAELDVIGWESTRGEWPRGMNLDPSGSFLYVGNQNSNTIAVFRVQPSNGKLKFSTIVNTPTPVDIEFGPLA